MERLLALKDKQYAQFKEVDDLASKLRHDWAETCVVIEILERELMVERLVAERLAGKVA